MKEERRFVLTEAEVCQALADYLKQRGNVLPGLVHLRFTVTQLNGLVGLEVVVGPPKEKG